MRQFSVGWWNDVARAIFGFQEHTPLELEDAVRAVAVLEADRPEWGVLKNEHRWGGTRSAAAVAGQFSAVGVKNPRSSNIIVVVYYIKNNSAGAAVDVLLGVTNEATDLVPGEASVAQLQSPLDSRVLISSTNTGASGSRVFSAISAGGIAGGIFVLHDVLTPQAAVLSISHPHYVAVLAPGGFLGIQGQAVLTAVSGFFHVRERPLHKGVRA